MKAIIPEPPQPIAKTTPPKRTAARTDGMVEKYGLLVPATALSVSVELMCYRDAGTPLATSGNLGAEEHFRRAWRIMWPDYEWSDWVDLLIHAWCNYKWITVIGHQRASKSYTMAFACLLDYCADPANTLTSMGTVTFDGLRIRMWSDLQRAAETARIKFPFTYRNTTNEMRVYPTEFRGDSSQKFQIMGMALNNSKDAEGRIRGGHAPRRRLFLDEAENIADPIYEAMINPMSAPDAKCAMLCNPMEKISKFGQRCEPRDGWESVSPTSLMWETKASGGVCIHLDGLQSPNIKAGKNKFIGLLTQENIDEVLRMYGENSVQWWSLIRGWFPPDGLVSRIFPANTIEKMRKTIVFDFKPMKGATMDPAFEGDDPVLHLFDLGPVKRGDRMMSVNFTHSTVIRYQNGPEFEPKEYQLAHQIMQLCKEHGVKPEHYIQDTTGNGRGVFAILQKEWSKDVQGVNYGGKATERNLRADDDRKCEDVFKYYVSELWGRAAEFGAEGLIGGLDNLDEKTKTDLTARRYKLVPGDKGKLILAEPKAEMKNRLGRSPDFGDAFVQVGELLERLGTRPGLGGGMVAGGGKWEGHRRKAKQLAETYSESGEFGY